MQNNKTAIDRIINKKERLSNKQRQLCDYIVENNNKIATLTIKELADKADVGTTTVMRTIKRLNYASFTDFKKDMHQASLEQRPTTWWPLQKVNTNEENGELPHFWNEILMSMDKTYTNDLVDNIDEAVSLMKKSSRINVLGLRSSKAAATYFGTLLSEFSPNVYQLSNEVEFLYDHILQMKKSEVIFVFVQSPFAVYTLRAAEYCKKMGVKIVLVTDLLSCPIVPISDILLKVETCENQYSIVSTIALVEILVIKYARATLPESMHYLEKLGKVLVDENVATTYKGIL